MRSRSKANSSMPMSTMHIGSVRMCVPQRSMIVWMSMGLARRVRLLMRVLVMRVMHVRVLVLHRLMDVFVFVVLGKVQPDSQGHKQTSSGEPRRRWIAQRDHGGERAHKRRGCEVGAGARRSKFAERKNEQYEAHAVRRQSLWPRRAATWLAREPNRRPKCPKPD
jgi:hypothetical protein